MEKLIIGTVKVEYNEQGKATSAYFHPEIKIDLIANAYIGSDLLQISGDTQEVFQKNADLVLGAWFAKMNQIELANRERYEIASTVIECEKYPNGSVKSCALEYVFQERPEFLN